MYKDIETETSYKYAQAVISKLKEPLCMLGGWAVYFTVKDNYAKQKQRPYIGSRDIDIGFRDVATFKQASEILEKDLGFDFVSFRFFKNVHTETGKDVSGEDAKAIPQHLLFPLFVDPMLPTSDESLRTALGFAPLDEPLLHEVFAKRQCRAEIKEFGKNMILPSPEILLAMKLNAVMGRDKLHKRYKDTCDIVALSLFSKLQTKDIISKAKKLASKGAMGKIKRENFDGEIAHCSALLGLETATVKEVIGIIKG